MRALVIIGLALALALVAAPVAAQEAEALRRELEQMRRQFEQVQQEYRQALERLTERLQHLESQQRAQPTGLTAPSPGTAPPPPAVTASAPTTSASGQPTPLELVRPREPFALAERRGAGQLLFDVGIVADLVGNLTQHTVDKANAGTFAGRENRVFPREVEVNLYGRIDPYAQGHVRFEFAEEFENGERVLETKLAEAYLTLLTLPFGAKLSFGLQPVRFGARSHVHREALPQPDVPQVLLRFFGEEQFRETGVELSWIPPLPFYLETLVGVFNGDNETAFGRGSLRSPLVSGRVRTFFESETLGAVQLGLSAATGETPERHRSTLAGLDVKYKLVPDGWRHPLLTVAGEAIYSTRRVEVFGDPDGDGAVTGERRSLERFGWYVYGEIQPWKRWAGGLRYDSTQFPVNPGREWAVEPYLTFMPSDFLRFRLAWKHTERSHRDGFSANDATARIVDELLFQATFFLGAHQPHPF